VSIQKNPLSAGALSSGISIPVKKALRGPDLVFVKRRYSTGSDLNTYSALIQNFYSQETAPHPAIHIALNTGSELGEEAGVKAYIRLIHFAVPFDI
jgi:hypothetical protein